MDHFSNPKRVLPDIHPNEPPRKRLKTVNDPTDIEDIVSNHPTRACSPQAVDPLHMDELSWLDLAVTTRAAATYHKRYPRTEVQLAQTTLTTPWPRDDSLIGSSFTTDPGIVPTALHAVSSKLNRISRATFQLQNRAADTLMKERIRIQRFAVARGLEPPIRVGSHVPGSTNLGRLVVDIRRRLGRAEDSKRALKRLMYGGEM